MAVTSSKQTAHTGVTAGKQLIPGLAANGRSGRLHMVWVTAAGATGIAVVTDGVSSGGAQLANVSAPTLWSTGQDFDIDFQNGLWIVVTGTGADVQVTWE